MHYEDRFVELTDKRLTLRWYYFPGGSKRILLSDIEEIVEQSPPALTSRGRIWGTSTFRVWFALDWGRPWRSAVYIAKIREHAIRAGFSVENPGQFKEILEAKGLLTA